MNINKNKILEKNSVMALLMFIFLTSCSNHESSSTETGTLFFSEQPENVKSEKPPPETETTVSSKSSHMETALEKGKSVYEKTRNACHQAH